MRCLVTAGKHANNILTIARQAPITIQGLLEAVFFLGPPQDNQAGWGQEI
jgi:hypothetical protein